MRDLTVGREWKVILLFALPILMGNIFQQANTIIDSVIVGKFVGKIALAAIGATFPVIFIMVSLIIGIAIGGTVVIAQYFGAKDFNQVKRASDTMIIFMVMASLAMSVVGIVFSNAIFKLMHTPPEIIPQALIYIRVFFAGLIFVAVVQSICAVLRGLGDSKSPMYIMIFMTVVNITLDFLFIGYFKMGIEGAALASIIGSFSASVIAVFYVAKKQPLMTINPFKMIFDLDIFKQCVRIGLPTGLQQSFVALGMMAILAIVNPFGTDTVAAYTAASRIDSFAALFAMNFASALSTFVGQNIGAGKIHRVRSGLIITWLMTTFISVLITVIAFFFSHELIGMFTRDKAVIEIGSHYLIIVCSFYFLFSTMFTFTGVFRGAGDTIVPMFITLFALWAIRIPLSYHFSKVFGVEGIWWGIPAAWFVGALMTFLYYLKGTWKTKAVVKPVEISVDEKS